MLAMKVTLAYLIWNHFVCASSIWPWEMQTPTLSCSLCGVDGQASHAHLSVNGLFMVRQV